MNNPGKPENHVDVFGYFIDRTAKAIKADLNRRFKKLGVDITPEQWIILSKLYDKDGQAQVDLGEGTYKDAPTVSRIIDLLCRKGLTTRTPAEGDRRKFLIRITEKGRDLVVKAEPVVVQSRIDGWEGLNSADYKELMRIVNTIFDNLT